MIKIVIVEDEKLVARRIEDLSKEVLLDKKYQINKLRSFTEAKDYLFEHPVDLVLLDLNLNGKDGFNLLKLAASGAFHTIIISAYQDRAAEAFEHGVLDFIGKPFTKKRLEIGFNRFFDLANNQNIFTKFLSIRSTGKLKILKIDDIMYFKGAGIYVEVYLKNGNMELHDKSLEKLLQILPKSFYRIHKSYIVNFNLVDRFNAESYNNIECILENEISLPVSRSRYKEMKDIFLQN
jgi:two-component system, LytTR family, response regulator LytT